MKKIPKPTLEELLTNYKITNCSCSPDCCGDITFECDSTIIPGVFAAYESTKEEAIEVFKKCINIYYYEIENNNIAGHDFIEDICDDCTT